MKRILPFLLAAVMLLSPAVPAQAAKKKTAATVKRYTVLVLDNTVNMKGTPFAKETKYAAAFCKKLLKADGKNYISVVAYTKKGKAKAVSGFTNSYAKLKSAINKQIKCVGKADLFDAMKTAYYLTKEVSSGKTDYKNVVLCTDGLSEKGTKVTDGLYMKSDNKAFYARANKAYEGAEFLKARNYTVFTLSFFKKLSKDDKAFGERVIDDIVSDNYNIAVAKSSAYKSAFTTAAAHITSTFISSKKLSLEEGDTEMLYVTANGRAAAPVWSSSNEEVAKVSKKGKVTALNSGKATITAVVDGKKVKCKLTVAELKPDEQTTISLSPSSMTVYAGKTKTINAVVTGKDKSITWTSSKPSVATVDKDGVVTGVKAGTAEITAKAGGKTASVLVTVEVQYPAQAVYILHGSVLSQMGPKKISESGVQVVCNKGGKITKCGVYSFKINDKVCFKIACKGEKLKEVYLNCYLGKNGAIVYDSYNTEGHKYYLKRFELKKDSDGIWSKWTDQGSTYASIAMDLTDAEGNLLTASEKGIGSTDIQMFDDPEEMKAWLKS